MGLIQMISGCRPAFSSSVAAYDLIERINLGYFASLCGFHQRCRSLPKAAIGDPIDGVTVFVDLK
ncbi:MAG TPA: hypothetical protein VE377_06285 [Candidatus Dormibacteraeota bacterium]|nr:hypothetical protein [Candidatus Dormibacteraeota bacterium]